MGISTIPSNNPFTMLNKTIRVKGHKPYSLMFGAKQDNFEKKKPPQKKLNLLERFWQGIRKTFLTVWNWIKGLFSTKKSKSTEELETPINKKLFKEPEYISKIHEHLNSFELDKHCSNENIKLLKSEIKALKTYPLIGGKPALTNLINTVYDALPEEKTFSLQELDKLDINNKTKVGTFLKRHTYGETLENHPNVTGNREAIKQLIEDAYDKLAKQKLQALKALKSLKTDNEEALGGFHKRFLPWDILRGHFNLYDKVFPQTIPITIDGETVDTHLLNGGGSKKVYGTITQAGPLAIALPNTDVDGGAVLRGKWRASLNEPYHTDYIRSLGVPVNDVSKVQLIQVGKCTFPAIVMTPYSELDVTVFDYKNTADNNNTLVNLDNLNSNEDALPYFSEVSKDIQTLINHNVGLGSDSVNLCVKDGKLRLYINDLQQPSIHTSKIEKCDKALWYAKQAITGFYYSFPHKKRENYNYLQELNRYKSTYNELAKNIVELVETDLKK